MPIRNVGDAMREMQGGSTKIQSRPQAIAVGLKAQRQGGKRRVPQVRSGGRRGGR